MKKNSTSVNSLASSSMCIGMFTNLFYPVATGSSTQSRGLAKTLVEQGHKVILITARLEKEAPEYEVIDGIDVYRIPSIRLPKLPIALNFSWLNITFWPSNLKRIEQILRHHRVEILHVHNHMFDMALSAIVMKRRLALPVVLTIHTIIKHSIKAFNAILFPADRFFLKHAVVKRADAVICPDVNISLYLKETFGRQDAAIIPYGINLPPHPGEDIQKKIVHDYGLTGRRVILSLGHVHALRNRLDLIRALPKVRERFPDICLLVVGAVEDQRPVALSKALGLENTVIFTGAQPHAHTPVYHDLAELEAMWFDQADGGMNPLGIACMEAMYAGNTVLTVSNINTFGVGVLENGRDVVLVKAGDPDGLADILNSLLSSPMKNQKIGQAARALSHDLFAWEKVAIRTSNLYKALLHQAPRIQQENS